MNMLIFRMDADCFLSQAGVNLFLYNSD